MKVSSFIIPKNITGKEDLVVLTRKLFEQLTRKNVCEHDILQWSKEAKKLKKENKLQKLQSLKNLR